MSFRDDLQDRRLDLQDQRDDLQDQIDAFQQRQIDRHSSRLSELDAITVSPGEAAENPAANPGSPAQRLRIQVPNVQTTLSLGAKAPADAIRGLDVGAPNYAGFGVHTRGHIFMSASDARGTSTATMQAKGNVVIQSEQGLLWAGSKEQAMLASKANAMLMGGTGVVIAGGSAVTWAPNPEPDGTEPQTPGWMSGFGDAGSTINRVWAGIDAAVAIGTGVKSAIAMKTSRPKGLGFAVAAANLVLGNVGGAIVSGLGATNSDPIGGTVIHGTGGVIVGSSHTMGLYSLTGTTLASALGASVLAPSVGVTGFHDATVEAGRSLEIKSGRELAITSEQGLQIASRKAGTTVTGKAVWVGSSGGGAGQDISQTVRIDAQDTVVYGNKRVWLTSTEEAVVQSTAPGSKASIYGTASCRVVSMEHAAVDGGRKATVSARDLVAIKVKDFGVELTPKGIYIGSGTDVGDVPQKKKADPVGIPRNFGDFLVKLKAMNDKQAEYDKAFDNEMKAYEANVAKNKADNQAAIVIKKGKIEIQIQGNKFELDSSKLKHGGLVSQK